MAERKTAADKQTTVQLDQATLEAIIEGVSQRILSRGSTSRSAEGEVTEGVRERATGKLYI